MPVLLIAARRWFSVQYFFRCPKGQPEPAFRQAGTPDSHPVRWESSVSERRAKPDRGAGERATAANKKPSKMSETEFDKLSETEKKVLRGD